ncbi:MAG: adenylosuccinate synthase [Planctomycetales bacterium]|nr:adenylosuccinate synthase [Planctomycetales bacterium]
MPGTCVVGLQWGDEAKGKLVDLLTSDFEIVVRYQGGANAGHTVVVGDQTYKLHHIPSGILSHNVKNLISPGVVLNPPTILDEIDALAKRNVKVDNLMISDRSHVVLPWHIAEDRLLNAAKVGGVAESSENIGTTLRGIGPCYRDKVGRTMAVRFGDMYRPEFKQQIERIVESKNQVFQSLNGDANVALDAAAIFEEYSGYAERLKPHVGDTTALLLDAIDEDKNILFEGAQGALLDIDHGTFPFVTSSNSSGAGVFSGAGVPARFVNRIIGVIKAYSTRVGGGPFPTEQDNDDGQHIRDRGNEYGTTTGRPRRCGWFDAVAVRYTARLSGVDMLSLMMLDVLAALPEIKVCVAYEIDGKRVEHFPSHSDDLRRAVPIYETLPGWQQEITEVERVEDLPENAIKYVNRISELVGRPVGVISVGPDRRQTMFLDKDLAQRFGN